MDVNHFIKSREKDWQRLQTLIDRRRGRGTLTAAEVKELGVLYRAVTSDLALARRDYPRQKVNVFLNQLLTRVHSYIYQQDVSDYGSAIRYFTHVIPQTFRQTGIFTLIAFLLFLVPFLIGFGLAYNNPEGIAAPLGLEAQREILADQSTWTDIPVQERPFMSSFIMTNNIRVCMMAFGGGMAAGLFTLYVMTFNGLHIGAILGLATHYGMGQTLLDFIFGHGVIELSIIFMSGGAGLQLGWAIINPGIYTRKDAIGLAARRAVPLVVLAIPALITAGLIEGFISPSSLPFAGKVAVGLISGGIMYAYLLLSGRE